MRSRIVVDTIYKLLQEQIRVAGAVVAEHSRRIVTLEDDKVCLSGEDAEDLLGFVDGLHEFPALRAVLVEEVLEFGFAQ